MAAKPLIIAIANQKGGVAKTTTCECLAAALHKKGAEVLVIDLDVQANLSTYAGAVSGPTVYNVLTTDKNRMMDIGETIQRLPWFDLCPSSKDEMGNIEAELNKNPIAAMFTLRDRLEKSPAISKYNVVLMDCPPNLSYLVVNALCVADVCLIPANRDLGSKEGIEGLLDLIKSVQDRLNKKLQVAGIVLTRTNARTKIGQKISGEIDAMAKECGYKVFNTQIRQCVTIDQAHDDRKNVIYQYPSCNISLDYTSLAEEFIKEFATQLMLRR